MLSKRFKYDRKPVINLNDLQLETKKQIERKIDKGGYSFEDVPCCICGGRNFEILSEKDRYGLYAPTVICKDCGLIQTNPRMTQESYNQFYDTEYRELYVGIETPKEKFFKNQYEKGKKIYNYLKSNLGFDLVNLKVLEVGTGAGGIVSYFKEKGNEICGCDLGSEYIAFGRDKYNLDLQVGTIDALSLNGIPDIVIYSDTLEHVLNPVEEMTKLRSIIDTFSIVFIKVPGIKYMKGSLPVIVGRKGNFLYWIQNAHTYYFSLKTLRNIMEKAGYEFVCGNELIYSIFKKSSNQNQIKSNYESDYADMISFLRRMEFYRFILILFTFIIKGLLKVVKAVGLYNFAKKIYYRRNNKRWWSS